MAVGLIRAIQADALAGRAPLAKQCLSVVACAKHGLHTNEACEVLMPDSSYPRAPDPRPVDPKHFLPNYAPASAALQAQAVASAWRPIETAPRDVYVLAWARLVGRVL